MKLLAVDTTGPVIGVALVVDGEVSARTERIQRGAEGRLAPWSLELCAARRLGMADLDGVAVAVGPGAFTGLRVGLAYASGTALALGVPVVGLSSLASRAGRGSRVLSMLDARKQRVYAQWFADGVPVGDPVDLPPEEVLADAVPGFEATGEGAGVYRALVEAAGGTLRDRWEDPCVDVLARMGEEALMRGEGVDPVAVRPTYLRAADARPPRFD